MKQQNNSAGPVSSRNLGPLRTIDGLRELMQSLAMLDAILESSWSARHHHFNARWATDMQLGSMINGEGDSWFCIFNAAGAVLKGFDHESEMSPSHRGNTGVWPGILENVPQTFKRALADPSLSIEQTTFCIWRLREDSRWHRGTIDYPNGQDPDGSARLLKILDGSPITYRQWAESYFERLVNTGAIQEIYLYRALTNETVQLLNPQRELGSLHDDIAEIGYPVAIDNERRKGTT